MSHFAIPVIRFLTRAIAIAAIPITAYILVGSRIYDFWWWGLFWVDRSWSQVADGVTYLIDENFGLAVFVIFSILTFVVSIIVFRPVLVPVLDKCWMWIVLGCALTAGMDALFLLHQFGGLEYVARYKKAMADLIAIPEKFKSTFEPPQIDSVAYFYYLDADQVESLFNQTEDEMREKVREVSGSKKVSGELSIGVKDSHAQLNAGKEQEQKSTFEGTGFLPERKCVAVMRALMESGRARYYTQAIDWAFDRQFKKTAALLNRDAPINERSIEALRVGPDQNAALAKELKDALQSELSHVKGFVFVDGDFTQLATNENILLLHDFGDAPLKCTFRVYLPRSVQALLPKTKPLHLRTFGYVARPLGKDGYVDVSGIAVF